MTLNRQQAADDLPSSDDEGTAERKTSEQVQTAQTTRGSEIARLGSEKTSLMKRSQKAFKATTIHARLTPAELDLLQNQCDPGYNLAVATSDPRLLLAIVVDQWFISNTPQSWYLRVVEILSGATVSQADASYAHILDTLHSIVQRR